MIINGDSLLELPKLDHCSVDAVVTDPPYGLTDLSPRKVAACLQAWSSGETFNAQGSGFQECHWDSWVPGPELWREVCRVLKPGGHALVFAGSRSQDLMSIALRLGGFEVRDTLQWLYASGFPKHIGSALKPAHEPIILVRKPLKGSFKENVSRFGVGALNIEQTRVGSSGGSKNALLKKQGVVLGGGVRGTTGGKVPIDKGRFPTNVILDQEASLMLDRQTGRSVSRFFYCAKASTQEREAGLSGQGSRLNTHPTVKPLNLMRYLCKLITPSGGLVLDPFAGSGSTLCAAALEGFKVLGIERDPDFCQIAQSRLAHWSSQTEQLSLP